MLLSVNSKILIIVTSVRTLVWRLRNKLETDIIKNASGIGYYIEE
jgi:DNA-binding response OmpR family regulator